MTWPRPPISRLLGEQRSRPKPKAGATSVGLHCGRWKGTAAETCTRSRAVDEIYRIASEALRQMHSDMPRPQQIREVENPLWMSDSFDCGVSRDGWQGHIDATILTARRGPTGALRPLHGYARARRRAVCGRQADRSGTCGRKSGYGDRAHPSGGPAAYRRVSHGRSWLP